MSPRARRRGRHHFRYPALARALMALLMVGIAAAALAAGTHLARPQVLPHCLRAQNCVCRDFGQFIPGHNRCPELTTTAITGRRP